MVDFSLVQNILIVKLRHHGDVLLTSPLYQVLKQHHPHVSVDALVYDETSPMLLGHSSIRQVFSLTKSSAATSKLAYLKSELSVFRQLKKVGYDLVIHLTENWRGAWLCRYINPRYSVVRRYPDRENAFWMRSFTHHYASPFGLVRHTVEMHLDALRCIGVEPHDREKQLVLGVNAEIERDFFQQYPALLEKSYVLIHPTSRWMFKCWPADKVAEIAHRIHQEGYQLVFSAAPDKKELTMMDDILQQLNVPVIDFSGVLSLAQLAVLIKSAHLYFGVDSAPMHMAAALNTSTVAIFGPTSEVAWGPWNSCSTVVTSDHSCRPCDQDGCQGSKVSECLTTLEIEKVWSVLYRQLRNKPTTEP